MASLSFLRHVLQASTAGVIAIMATTGASFAANSQSVPAASEMPNAGSLAAAGIVFFALAIAGLLNHAQPKLRASGTGLAGVACFGIVGWFLAALGTGVLADPKPFQAPMDALKPFLLWAQTGTALVGGLVLFAVAARQMRSERRLVLSNANEATRYGRVSRMIHWTTAILFIVMIPKGIFMSMIPSNAWFRIEYAVAHETIGVIILGLVIVRVIWNRRSKRPELDPSLKPVEHKLAHRAHLVLYFLMFTVPITGYVMTTMHGFPLSFFNLKIGAIWGESGLYVVWGLFHKYILQYVIYLILGAHILGALKHQIIDKHDNALKRMVS